LTISSGKQLKPSWKHFGTVAACLLYEIYLLLRYYFKLSVPAFLNAEAIVRKTKLFVM